MCRELTKLHEEVVRGTLLELSARYPVSGPDATPLAGAVRGEITLVIDLGAAQDEASTVAAQAGCGRRGAARARALQARHRRRPAGVPRRPASAG